MAAGGSSPPAAGWIWRTGSDGASRSSPSATRSWRGWGFRPGAPPRLPRRPPPPPAPPPPRAPLPSLRGRPRPARDRAGDRAAVVAALVWTAQGMFGWESTGGFVELALAGFVALAAWHLVSLHRAGRAQDALWAGLAAGVAAGTKYHGLLFVPVFALLVL